MRPGMIEVTGIPLEALVLAAYRPSRAQGLGHMHYEAGDLTESEVSAIIERGKTDRMFAVYTDYVKGRSLKFKVQRKNGLHFIENRWYDHSDGQLKDLLTAVGLSPDLVDAARAEEKAYYEAVIAEAVSFLKEKDGRFVELDTDRRAGKSLPDRIDAGLIYGSDENGPIISKWVDEGKEYVLRSTHAETGDLK